SLVLSLGPTHSFPLEEVKRYLNSKTARDVLVQAVLQAPMFGTRWRWAASVALAVARNRSGKRVPPQWQRSDAEDLLTHAFPDAVACRDNLPGECEVPDHPLVQQTLNDCLHDVMDVDGMVALLRRIESGAIEIVCRDLTAPSPLSESILNARPYAFLDDGAAEERRTNAVRTSGVYEPQSVADYGRLDPAVIEQVRAEMQPGAANEDELHDALVVNGFLTDTEAHAAGEPKWLDVLMAARRVVRLHIGDEALWIAAERLHEMRALFPDASIIGNAPTLAARPDADTALREIARSRLEICGPVTAAELGAPLGLSVGAMAIPLAALEGEGYVMRGDFSARGEEEWCERRRLARIHRYTRERRRAEFEPVPAAAFMRFLFDWQGVSGQGLHEGPAALDAVLHQLEGFPVAAGAWEAEILPARVRDYDPQWLDQLCASGRFVWRRPASANLDSGRKAAPVRATPILLLPREHAMHWTTAAATVTNADAVPELSGAATAVLNALHEHGASFFVELVADSHQLRSHVETALGELVSHGLVTSDGFTGLRALVAPADFKARRLRRGGVQGAFAHLEAAGRWSLLRSRRIAESIDTAAQTEYIVRALLRRYGVVFRKLVERESQLPPWRELFYVLRRLEARGEIRGGRFVSGYAGEQFALPEAAGSLRRYRENDADEMSVTISACDPLNLTGILLPGERVPSIAGNRILFRSGVPVASRVGGEIRYLVQADLVARNDWHGRLIRGANWIADTPQAN
ncbi:MAG TPA: ATP-dependent DNA helicase, partial [Burkholderiales bacterium]